jgi:hypothetical protein
MQVYCSGTAGIEDKTTGLIHQIECDDLHWYAVGGEEREMGSEVHYEAEVDHPQLGMLTWSIWEYPSGIQHDRKTDVGDHQLLQDFDYGLKHVPEPELWADYSLPDNPFTIFMSSYHHANDLLADYGGDAGSHLVNRMIFSHQVTALEAYLGDTLMKAILADKAAMNRLIETDKDIMKEKFSLAEIAANPNLVETTVRKHLRSILYHNLERVNFLYRSALGIRLLDLARDADGLFKVIIQRHDCVHRNGFDKDGNELKLFTKQYVHDTSDLIKDFVEKIEREVRARPA